MRASANVTVLRSAKVRDRRAAAYASPVAEDSGASASMSTEDPLRSTATRSPALARATAIFVSVVRGPNRTTASGTSQPEMSHMVYLGQAYLDKLPEHNLGLVVAVS